MIFMILLYFSFLILIIFLDLKFREFQAGLKESTSELDDCFRPFSVSEYLNKLEETALEIKQMEEGVDRTIILWWGLDGLRLNEDGSMKWISRKKPKLVNQNVFYQPCQSIQTAKLFPSYLCQTQSTRAQIGTLMEQSVSLQMQAVWDAQNMAIISQIQPPLMPCRDM